MTYFTIELDLNWIFDTNLKPEIYLSWRNWLKRCWFQSNCSKPIERASILIKNILIQSKMYLCNHFWSFNHHFELPFWSFNQKEVKINQILIKTWLKSIGFYSKLMNLIRFWHGSLILFPHLILNWTGIAIAIQMTWNVNHRRLDL